MTISVWLQLILIVSSTGFSKTVEDSLAKSHIFENQNIFENFNFIVKNLNINSNKKETQEDLIDNRGIFENNFNSKAKKVPTSPPSSHIPSNCAEAVRLSGRTEGVHQIRIPGSHLEPFNVYCLADPDGDGGPWTLIQRRINGSVNFEKGWDDYVSGFGNLDGEFFIGLEKLHELTLSSIHELWIQMEDFSNDTRWAKYSSFAVDEASRFYALNVLGTYTGDAGDSLRLHEGQKFSTNDSDNDSAADRSCAIMHSGAWWYNQCHRSNLNGVYLRGDYHKDLYSKGIVWYNWKGYLYSLKYVHMAIRPINSN